MTLLRQIASRTVEEGEGVADQLLVFLFLSLTALVQVNTANNQAFTGTVRLRWELSPRQRSGTLTTALGSVGRQPGWRPMLLSTTRTA